MNANPGVQWGNQKYRDGRPVMKRAVVCHERKPAEKVPSAAGHLCSKHEDHEDEHKCLCSVTWPQQPATTNA